MAVARTGLTRLSVQETDESAVVEYLHSPHSEGPLIIYSSIVFVHGLFGHPENTWTYNPNAPARHTGTFVAPEAQASALSRTRLCKNGLS